MKTAAVTLFAALLSATTAASAAPAMAKSAYDGAWSLTFVTRSGACDPSYNFNVNIANGRVSHPNLVRFTGKVAPSGIVNASVTVMDKHAAGSGKLSNRAGSGKWSGYAGNGRCAGYWTATRKS